MSDDKVVFHAMAISANNACIRCLLKYAKIEYEELEAWGKTRTPEFIAKFPNNCTPAIEHKGTVFVTESLTILRYLTKVYDSAKALYPHDDPVQGAKIDMVSDYTNTHLTSYLAPAVYGYLGFPAYPGSVEGMEETKEHAQKARDICNEHILEVLNDRYAGIFLKDTKFLWSDVPTIADFRFAPLLSFVKVGNILPERIQKYLDDMHELEGFTEGCKPMDDFAEKFWKKAE